MSETITDRRELIVSLPMTPDRRLAPNRANGRAWRSLAEVRKEQRHAARLALLPYVDASREYPDPPMFAGPVAVEILIRWGRTMMAGPRRARVEQVRPLDADAALSASKHILDALADVGILGDDRQIVAATIRQSSDPAGAGETVITIRREES